MPQTKGPAAAELEKRVAAAMAKAPGVDRATATLNCFRADESLREKFLAEQNAKPAPAASKFTGAAAVAEFERRVGARKLAGATAQKAVSDTVAEDPALHAAYLAAKQPAPRR
jgi:hypothetical protein